MQAALQTLADPEGAPPWSFKTWPGRYGEGAVELLQPPWRKVRIAALEILVLQARGKPVTAQAG